MLKKTIISLLVAILPLPFGAMAQSSGYPDPHHTRKPRVEGKAKAGERVRFVYDVDFDFRFDNREYDRSSYSPSMTVFGARLTPSIGLGIGNDSRLRHSGTERKDIGKHTLMLGIDIMKNFGASPISPETAAVTDAGTVVPETSPSLSNIDLLREIIFYYRWEKSFRRTDMTLTAGIFPRSGMKGKYSTAFFSDSLKFYDNNIEGLLLEFHRPNASYEVGCDWMGQYGKARRERFMIFSSGEASVTDVVRIGYSATLYHFAGCENVHGVVDNILVNPYAGVDFSRMTGLQAFRADIGWLQSCQNDRRNVGKYVFPHGAEFIVGLRNWNVGVENRLFYGTDMMPYYDCTDAAGIKYGNSLYFGDTFFRVTEDRRGFGIYDRLEIYYEPGIASFLTLRIGAVLHFNEGFSGWQQTVSLRFDLSALRRG